MPDVLVLEAYFGPVNIPEDQLARDKFFERYVGHVARAKKAVAGNSAICGMDIYRVDGIVGLNVIVLISIVQGREAEVQNDPGIKELMAAAGEHGMRIGTLTRVPLPTVV